MKYELVSQFPAGSTDDFERLVALEDRLIAELDGLAMVDGHDFGLGEFNIFILTDDPDESFNKARPVVTDQGVPNAMRSAHRQVDGENYAADFSINVRSWYHVTLWVDSDFSGCQSGFSHLALDSRSTVYNDGHAIESAEGIDRYLGHFYADKKGRYNVRIEIISDPSCLNEGHPRIGVWTDSSRGLALYYELRNIGQIIAIAGIGLLAFALSKIKPPVTIAPGTEHACYFHPKQSPRALLPLLPPFGLSYTLLLTSVIVPTFLVFLYAWGWERPSMGIRMSTAETPLLSARVSSEFFPLLRLKFKEKPGRLCCT